MKRILLSLALFMMTATAFAQDWPNLKKYEAANQEVLASATRPKAVFMGNFITQGWWQQRPEFFKSTASWAGASGADPERCSTSHWQQETEHGSQKSKGYAIMPLYLVTKKRTTFFLHS